MQGLVAGNDLEGQILRPLVAVAAVSHTGDLGKYLFANIRDQRWNSSHVTASNIIKLKRGSPKPAAANVFTQHKQTGVFPCFFSL